MIEDLRFIAQDDTLLMGYVGGVPFEVPFSAIRPYWDYANEEDFEGGFAKVFDNKILFVVLTASSQDGVVVLWNAETDAIDHISEGSYSIAVDMDEDHIYTLRDVSNYCIESNLQVWEAPRDTMDATNEGKVLANGLATPRYNSFDECVIQREKNGFEIKVGDQDMHILTIDLT